MQHCALSNGQLALVSDPSESNAKVYTIQSCDQVRSMLSIGLVPTTSTDSSSSLVVELNFQPEAMKIAHVQINYRFSDAFQYLSICAQIRANLDGQIIDGGEEKVIMKAKDTEYEVIIKQVSDQTFNPAEALSKLSLAPTISIINEKTRVLFSSNPSLFTNPNPDVLVGYEYQYRLMEKLIFDSLSPASSSAEDAVRLPRTLLLTGPSGTGKTLAIRKALAQSVGRVNAVVTNCSTLVSKFNEFDKLRSALQHLIRLEPSVLFIDNLEDGIASDKNAQMEKKLIAWLKMLLDELPRTRHVLFVGVTSRADMLGTSLRRPGRFDVEIEFPIPTPSDRRLILRQHLANQKDAGNITTAEMDTIADAAHGFTGADLRHLCEMTALDLMERNDNVEPLGNTLTLKQLQLTLRRSRPSIMREITLERPNVSWDEIGGLDELRHLLEETVIWPIKYPVAFQRMGIEPPRGVLMYGPPGCCKTMIGKALASESRLNFFSIKGPEVFNKWVGESERAIREIFRKARAAAPAILFFDEIDALAAERGQQQSAVGDRVLAQLLTEIDGVEVLGQVVIIAATNRPDIVDKALLRPGRLDSMVYVPLPDAVTRREIFLIKTRKMPLEGCENGGKEANTDLIDRLTAKSAGYTGAEITAICQRAGLIALGESIEASTVREAHFELAFDRVRPRISSEMIDFYDRFAAKCDELKCK